MLSGLFVVELVLANGTSGPVPVEKPSDTGLGNKSVGWLERRANIRDTSADFNELADCKARGVDGLSFVEQGLNALVAAEG